MVVAIDKSKSSEKCRLESEPAKSCCSNSVCFRMREVIALVTDDDDADVDEEDTAVAEGSL
jgi:hypothetical protein